MGKKYRSLIREYFAGVSDDFFYSHSLDYWVDQIPRDAYEAIEIAARDGKVKQIIETKVENKSHIPCFVCQKTPTIGECVCREVRLCGQECMDIHWANGH